METVRLMDIREHDSGVYSECQKQKSTEQWSDDGKVGSPRLLWTIDGITGWYHSGRNTARHDPRRRHRVRSDLRTAHQTMVKARKHDKSYDEFQSEPTVKVSQIGVIIKSPLYRSCIGGKGGRRGDKQIRRTVQVEQRGNNTHGYPFHPRQQTDRGCIRVQSSNPNPTRLPSMNQEQRCAGQPPPQAAASRR
jgi:hypothetical protein